MEYRYFICDVFSDKRFGGKNVTGEDGATQSWTAWFTSANNLFRRGWRADDLPVGEIVMVSGFPARDGSSELYGGETTLPDGRTLFAGNAPGER